MRAKNYTVFLLSILLLTLISCNKGKDTPKTSDKDFIKDLNSSSDLLKLAPSSTFGFLTWDLTNDAYQFKKQTAWADTSLLNFEEFEREYRIIAEAAKKSGINFSDLSTYEKHMSQGVVFASPNPGNKFASFAVLFKSSNSGNAETLVANFEKELQKTTTQISVKNASFGQLLEITLDNHVANQPPPKVYLGAKGKLGILATDEYLVEEVLIKTGEELPSITQTDEFKSSVQNFPIAKNRIVFGYIDINKGLSELNSLANKFGIAQHPALSNLQSVLPLKTAAWANYVYNKEPRDTVRFITQTRTEQHKKILTALGTSSSSSLTKVLPYSPILFLSVDGKSLFKLNEQVIKTSTQSNLLAQANQISRIGISVNNGQPGMSLLPIPEILILAEGSDVDSVKSSMINFATGLARSFGISQSLLSKTVQGQEVQYAMSPLGFGIYVTSKDNLVIAASNEVVLSQTLQSFSTDTPLSKASDRVINQRPSLLNFHLDLKRLGAFLSGMGAMASQYGARGSGAFLPPQTLKKLSSLGSLAARVEVEGDVITYNCSYFSK